MTMRNRGAVHIDTTDIDGLIAANPRWGFSNLDLIAERGGHFLVQEWKRPEEEMATGQKLLLKALAASPRFTVIVVTGDTDDGTSISEIRQVLLDKLRLVGTTLDDLRRFVRDWYEEIENA